MTTHSITILYELYKWGGASMIDLLELFRVIWSNEKMPDRWNESRVILLHKGGHKSKKELTNYCLIAIMDTVENIFVIILQKGTYKFSFFFSFNMLIESI